MPTLLWMCAALAAPQPSLDGSLADVAELRFSVAFHGDAVVTRGWSWSPPTGRVTAVGGAGTFVLGHPATDGERELERLFLADTFWLDPALHVAWAAAGTLVLEDRGTVVAGGRVLHAADLVYPPIPGATAGDVHALQLDDAGVVMAWTWRPLAGAPALTATFEDRVQVGPLRIAGLRRVTGATDIREVRVRDLGWTPVGTAISSGADSPPVVHVTRGGCRFASAHVAWRDPPPARALPAAEGVFDQELIVAGPSGAVRQGWSGTTLALADERWLATSEILGCDFGALDDAALRAALEPLHDRDRATALAVLWGWAWGSGTLGTAAGPLVAWIRRDAVACARLHECEAIYADLRRVR